ncbi:MAG: hypothetical protein H6732_14535 [Alphaproteobacteria bacterium]|nr:hypothetical protein [Alphaproteobacteria bacterium]
MRLACVSREHLPDWEVDDRPLHAALRAAGVHVEQPAWSDPAVDWTAYDALLLRTPWDYHERLDAFLAWCARVAPLRPLWHGPEVVRWNVRKTYLLELQEDGVPVAPTVLVPAGDVAAMHAGVAGLGATRCFLKPVVGATAWQTLRFDAASLQLAEAHVRATHAPMLLQPYLEGVESEGEWSVVWIDGAPTHGVRKTPVPGDYRVQDDWGGRDERVTPDAELSALAAQAMAAAARRTGTAEPFLYGRVDALRHDGRWVLNELELVEPSLFFRHGPEAVVRLAAALVRRLGTLDGASGVGSARRSA